MRNNDEKPGQSSTSIIGSSVPRNEDHRHLAGDGRFAADIRLPGMQEAVFVRSTVAHGRIRKVLPPDGIGPDQFWSAKELEGAVRPVVARLKRPQFRTAEYPALAKDKVRYVGEPIAVVLAHDRATAEDIAEGVTVDIDPLDPVTSAEHALEPTAPLVHEHWPDNTILEISRSIGDVDLAAREADLCLTREYRMARLSHCAIETRGLVVTHDRALKQLVLYLATQRPHVTRSFLAQQLVGIDERQIRVITPDIGGAFGGKATLYAEELVLAAIAMRTAHPVRWVEDRLEAFTATTQAREQVHRVTAYAKRTGEILAVDAEILVDGGAYSVWPPTAVGEGNMAANVLPGPYRLRNYRYKARTVTTNKTPAGPFRGVGRPAACFAMERTLDELAHALGLEPAELRLRNFIAAEEFPFKTATGLVYDSGDYSAMLRKAMDAIDQVGIRNEQARGRADPKTRVGLGYAAYVEQTAHGAQEWSSRGAVIGYGFESARARLHPSGTLTIDVGIQSHGQGLETTLAQIASHVTSIPYTKIAVRYGDTEVSPYGLGTGASRSIVTAGGATHQACVELATKIRAIGASLLECSSEEVTLIDGCVRGPTASVTFAEVADAAYHNVQRLPSGVSPGLEILSHYRPAAETGAFSAGLHAVKVEVCLDTGRVCILDYVVVEDCGVAINPKIVDGQILGGMAQGIGQALFEELRYSEVGQPQHVTFSDYLLPGAPEVPDARIYHQITPSPFTVHGMKGMGEGGCIAPPAAIANAVTDALKEFRISVSCTPISPAALWLAIQEASTCPGEEIIPTRETLR